MSLFPSLSYQLQTMLKKTSGISIHALISFTANAQITMLSSRTRY